MKKITLVGMLLLLSGWLLAQSVHSDTSKRWYVPTHATIQYAGGFGFLSGGLGYDLFSDHLSVDVLFGYLPEPIGGIDIYSLNTKTIFKPWVLSITEKERINFSPIFIGITTMHAFGNQYTKFKKSGHYPQGYYWWPNSTRFGITFGQNYFYTLNANALIHTLELYWSVSADDLGMYSYFENHVVKRSHIYTMDFGAKIYF
jgi:hypothetical protein